MTSQLADYSDQVTVTQLDTALRALNFDGGVWHYIHGNFALRIETFDVVNGIRALGWAQGGIDVPTLDSVDGAHMVAAAHAYAFPPGSKLLLDIEPVEFNAAPARWAAAADGWCDDIRHDGYVPVVYGTDATLLACASHADFILRAVPGNCDPTSPGLPGLAQLPPWFFAGKRANQCSEARSSGIVFDVSVSEFTLALPVPLHQWGSSKMISFEYNGQAHTFDTDSTGAVQHRYFVTGVGWAKDVPLSGLVPFSPLAWDVGYNGQVHIWGRRADGQQGHAYFGTDNTGWHAEVLA